jgi:hypothetical protein
MICNAAMPDSRHLSHGLRVDRQSVPGPSPHFLMRGLAHVSTEMSLHVLAYNMKRVISPLGMAKTP